MKTEQQTRAEMIDQQLAKAGWNVNDPTLRLPLRLKNCQATKSLSSIYRKVPTGPIGATKGFI